MAAIQMRKEFTIIGGIFLVIILAGVGYFCLYGDECSLVKNWLTKETRGGRGAFLREIGTNIDLWLNGYLGIFFRFKMFGVLNWLAFPLFIYFLFTIRKRERWEIALWMVLSASSVFLCIKGFKNYRYQLTLYPLLITIIVLFGWLVLHKGKKKTLICVSVICSFFVLLNTFYLKKDYKYYLKSAIGEGAPGEGFPYKLIEFISTNIGDDSLIWEKRQPILYYYTDKKGVPQYNKNAKYVLIRGNIRKQFKDVRFDLMAEDQGYKLYKILNKSDYPTIDDLQKNMPDFEINFMNQIGNDNVSDIKIDKIIFPMRIQSFRGDFSAQKISNDTGNSVRIQLIKPFFNKRPDLQLGCCIQTDEINLKVESGNLLNIVAKARVKKKNSAELFIQDKTDYWSRESVYLTKNNWNNFLVRKRIREGATQTCFGINWLPSTTDEWLDLKSIKIFIENE